MLPHYKSNLHSAVSSGLYTIEAINATNFNHIVATSHSFMICSTPEEDAFSNSVGSIFHDFNTTFTFSPQKQPATSSPLTISNTINTAILVGVLIGVETFIILAILIFKHLKNPKISFLNSFTTKIFARKFRSIINFQDRRRQGSNVVAFSRCRSTSPSTAIVPFDMEAQRSDSSLISCPPPSYAPPCLRKRLPDSPPSYSPL